MTVEALAVRAARTLDAAGVTWRLTKGPALAHLDYPDPALRPFGDVDVVVHPASWVPALDALVAAGGRREAAELAPGFDARFGKGATITTAEELEVDLHRRLAIGRFGVRLPTEALFTDVEIVTLGGRAVPALDGSSRLLHACYHAALGGFRHLRAHRDVAQLLLVTGVDWRSTVAVAERFRVAAVVARAIDDAWKALDLAVAHPAHAWARATPIGRADAKALAVFAAERPFHDQAVTAVPVLVGRGAAAYAWALARQPGRGAASAGALVRRGPSRPPCARLGADRASTGRAHPRHRRRQTVGQRRRHDVRERGAKSCAVGLRVRDIAHPGLDVPALERVSQLGLQQLDHGEEVGAGAEGQVHRVGIGEASPYGVADHAGDGVHVREVAALRPVPVHRQRAPVERGVDERRAPRRRTRDRPPARARTR